MQIKTYSAIALAGLIAQGCTPATEHRPKPPMVVDTLEVTAPVATQFRVFNGQVVAPELTPLAFRLQGEIKKVAVQEGDAVTKGQVLAILDDAKVKQSVADAKAKLNLASRQLNRGQELRKSGMISTSEYDELNANYKLAQANYRLAAARLSYTQLKAPYDGIVSEVPKQDFERAAAGETVLSVYRSTDVYVQLDVSDSVLSRLGPLLDNSTYQPIASFAGHGQNYPLTYLEHTSELSPETKTYQFWLKMPQVEPHILPGTSVKVSVDMVKAGIGVAEGYPLPMTAIDSAPDHRHFYVWKLNQGLAERVAVTVDQVTADGAIVHQGIVQGDTLVNSNLRKLRDGMQITGEPK